MTMQRRSTMLSDVRQLVATRGSLNQPNDDGVTLVRTLTCLGRSLPSVVLSLQLCIRCWSVTASLILSLKLHIACASGYREVVSVLLESGADPHPADNNFWTPLHLAAKYGQVTHRCSPRCHHVMDVE